MDRIEFRIHVRVCADGSVYSLTSHEIEEGGNTLDDVAQGEESYREYVLAVSAPLPPGEEVIDASVSIPDPEPAGVTAAPLPAA